MSQFKELDDIYDNDDQVKIYTSILQNCVPQKCEIHFETYENVADKHNNTKRNIRFNGIAIGLQKETEKFNNNRKILLYAPLKSFVNMFKFESIDIRRFILEKKHIQIEFIKKNNKHYILVDHKEVKYDKQIWLDEELS